MGSNIFSKKLESLVDEACREFNQVIVWKGQSSTHYSEQCLKISMYDFVDPVGGLEELLYINGGWKLIDSVGYQFNLEILEIESLAKLADNISHIIPHHSDAKEFPLIDYSGNTDLSEFPNFSVTGSVSGMKKQYYGKGAMLLRKGEYIYNVSSCPDVYLEVYDPEGDYYL